MKNKGSALQGFSALYDGTGNSVATVPVNLSCHITLEYELVRKCQMAGDRPHRGTPIGKMLSLYPFDLLKRRLLQEAEVFRGHMVKQGYEPAQATTEFELWGPYMEKVDTQRLHEEWIPEEGNHVIPAAYRAKAQRAWGYRGDELRIDKGVAFFIRGAFLASGRNGVMDEQTGVLIV